MASSALCDVISEIIPNQIYISSRHGVLDNLSQFVTHCRLSQIINVSSTNHFQTTIDRWKEQGIEYIWKPFQDYSAKKDVRDMIRISKELHPLIKYPVLLHCAMGVSRSVSVVVYHLMIRETKEYKDVLASIQSKRSIAQPNRGFEEAFETIISTELHLSRIKERHDDIETLAKDFFN